MEKLHQLLHSLQPNQVRVLKNYLTSFSSRNDPDSKSWELAEYVLSKTKKAPTLVQASHYLYGKKAINSINRLKNRLFDKVLNSLLIDISTDAMTREDDTHPVQIRIRKKMLLFDLLKYTATRGTVAVDMIQDVIKDAREYEFFPILIDALTIYKPMISHLKSKREADKIDSEITKYEKAKYYNIRAKDIVTELGQYSTFRTKLEKEKILNFLKDSIEELRGYYSEVGGRLLLDHLRTCEMALLQVAGQLSEGISLAKEHVRFLESNKIIDRKNRIGVWNDYIAHLEIDNENYDEAMKYLEKAASCFTSSPTNLAVNRSIQMEVYFHKGNYDKALEISADLIENQAKVIGTFRRDTFIFFQASCYFMKKEYTRCNDLLNERFELTRDKLGWDLNIRFLRIMTMIEMGKPDLAMLQVDALRKNFERFQHRKDITERDKMIIRLFFQMFLEGFAFQYPRNKTNELLLKLKEKGKLYSWEALKPEKIPIHVWALSRYQYKGVLPREEEEDDEEDGEGKFGGKRRPAQKAKSNA
ncbi:MAG TPA: hypothetical protein VFU15_08390 [Bacteroidia bacterium]|nr:hypothetical protein [Bacteroidia bacterium]